MPSTPGFKFTCNTCTTVFDSSTAQRAHMREAWHLYNLQRRMVSQPPVTLQEWDAQVGDGDAQQLTCPTCQKEYTNAKAYRRHVGKHATSSESSSSSDEAEEADDTDFGDVNANAPLLKPTECLFCNAPSPTLDANLTHMHTRHGLFIPARDRLADLPTLLGYLAALVCRYTECLYCGHRTASRAAAQAHMRDKGHCRIDVSVGSELADFWEGGGEDVAAAVRATEQLRLPSGAVVASRTDVQAGARHPPARVEAQRAREARNQGGAGSKAARSAGGAPARLRGEQGLTGLSAQQRRALAVVEHNMMKRAAHAQSAQRWAAERVANRQKFFRPDVPGRANG